MYKKWGKSQNNCIINKLIKTYKNIWYLFIHKKNRRYEIPQNIKRIIINNDLIKSVIKKNINVLIYTLDYINEIEALNKISKGNILSSFKYIWLAVWELYFF